MRGRPAGEPCAFCLKRPLTGRERPEHALPAALRSSIRVFTVCDPCNDWAGREIDQPFLDDPFVRLLRAEHDVRDPRHPDRPVLSPLARGVTAEGVHVAADEHWAPRIVSGRIIDRGDGRFDIVARDRPEAEKLAERVRRRAEQQGRTAELGAWETVEDAPHITGRLEIRPWRWRRALAKAVLAAASDAFDVTWRTGEDAARLRHWMRDPDALPYDHCPLRPIAGTAVARAVPAPCNAIWFSRTASGTIVNVVLLGEHLAQLVVDTTGRDLPCQAWLTDPARPGGDPRITYPELACGLAAERLAA